MLCANQWYFCVALPMPSSSYYLWKAKLIHIHGMTLQNYHKATFLCACKLCKSSAGRINLYCIIFYRAIHCNAWNIKMHKYKLFERSILTDSYKLFTCIKMSLYGNTCTVKRRLGDDATVQTVSYPFCSFCSINLNLSTIPTLSRFKTLNVCL